MTAGRAGTVLDRAMPEWDWSEFHHVRLDTNRSDVLEVASALTWQDVGLFRWIIGTVSLGSLAGRDGGRVLDLLLDGPYTEAHRDADELVVVGYLQAGASMPEAGRDTIASFRDASSPGSVKVAMNFLYRDGVLSTETRCRATDAHAARAFGLYWLAIRAGGGIIRRSWLHGIRRRVTDAHACTHEARRGGHL